MHPATRPARRSSGHTLPGVARRSRRTRIAARRRRVCPPASAGQVAKEAGQGIEPLNRMLMATVVCQGSDYNTASWLLPVITIGSADQSRCVAPASADQTQGYSSGPVCAAGGRSISISFTTRPGRWLRTRTRSARNTASEMAVSYHDCGVVVGLADAEKLQVHTLARDCIQRAKRLVQQQQLRLVYQGTSQGCSLGHAAGEAGAGRRVRSHAARRGRQRRVRALRPRSWVGFAVAGAGRRSSNT